MLDTVEFQTSTRFIQSGIHVMKSLETVLLNESFGLFYNISSSGGLEKMPHFPMPRATTDFELQEENLREQLDMSKEKKIRL